MRAVPASRARGEYTLRLPLRDGRTFEHAFDAELVDHAELPERHFAIAIPDPGAALARIEVLRGATPVPVRSLGRGHGAARRPGQHRAVARRRLEREQRQAAREWDTAAASHVAVTYVLDGTRTVLGVSRTGGVAEFDIGASAGRWSI